MKISRGLGAVAAAIVVVCTARFTALADAPNAPIPAAPKPKPSPGWSLHVDGKNVFVDQATNGPGATPPEGPAFANGDPNAPMSPYDWFSTAPLVPGVSGVAQYTFDVGYRWPKMFADAAFTVTGVDGSITNAIYWGEPLLGPIDPHGGRSSIPYSVV
ncbi:MAG TPA: hypothetical protein VGF18_01955, partial [Candidatus Tumulicola sp.]